MLTNRESTGLWSHSSSEEDAHYNPCPRGFPRLVSGSGSVPKIEKPTNAVSVGEEHPVPLTYGLFKAPLQQLLGSAQEDRKDLEEKKVE